MVRSRARSQLRRPRSALAPGPSIHPAAASICLPPSSAHRPLPAVAQRSSPDRSSFLWSARRATHLYAEPLFIFIAVRRRGARAHKVNQRTIGMNDPDFRHEALSKVPAITLGFWIIKILATTLGETGGDSVTMTWLGETTDHPVPYGYLIGTAIFGVLLIGLVIGQIKARRFNPWLYWATIVASTTCGTTLADFADRSLGIGYPGGSLLLLACVLLSLFVWWRAVGTVDVNTVATPREETFYWITITFSQTLGTALGDWAADATSDGGWGLGYSGGALVFGAGLAVLALLYFTSKKVSHV